MYYWRIKKKKKPREKNCILAKYIIFLFVFMSVPIMPQTIQNRTPQCSYSAVDADTRTRDCRGYREDDTQLPPHIGKLITIELLSNDLKLDKYPQICSSSCRVPPMHKHPIGSTDLLGICMACYLCVEIAWKKYF